MYYFGAVAVIVGVYMIWREYSAFLHKELLWCRSFLNAITDYRDKIKCYMDTPSGWAAGYSDQRLTECGFLERLREGDDFCTAYKSMCGACLNDASENILSACFERLGEGYLDTELEVLGIAIDKLGKEEARLTDALPKQRKAAGAVLGAFATGLIIFIM